MHTVGELCRVLHGEALLRNVAGADSSMIPKGMTPEDVSVDIWGEKRCFFSRVFLLINLVSGTARGNFARRFVASAFVSSTSSRVEFRALQRRFRKSTYKE